MNNNYFIKTSRIFTPLREYAWIFTLIVAIGGLWYPKLGLLVFGVILGLMVTGILKGRYWCGNICPHGSLFDHILFKISSNAKFPKFFQSTTLKIAAFIFFALSMTRRIISAGAYYKQAVFWDKLGYIFVTTYLMVLIVGIIFSLTINSRTWCNFCPMGTLQTLSYKLGKLLNINRKSDQKISITNKELCHSCGKCSKVCPMQLSPYKEFNEYNQFDNDVCIQCSTCVENCPVKILSIDKVNRS